MISRKWVSQAARISAYAAILYFGRLLEAVRPAGWVDSIILGSFFLLLAAGLDFYGSRAAR